MPRVGTNEVQAVIQVSSSLDVTSQIQTAHVLVNRIKSEYPSSIEAELVEVEKYLAAHFCAMRDPQEQTKSVNKASATFQGQTGLGLDLTWWGQQAKILDSSGYLAALEQKAKTPFNRIGMFAGTSQTYDKRSDSSSDSL